MHILLLDNYDSFTYNLYDYFLQLGVKCTVVRNDAISVEALTKLDIDALVLSPGPKRPQDAGILMETIAHFWDKKPILGVCLGHQALGEFFGATLVHASLPMHGKTSQIQHFQDNIFLNLDNPMQIMRYHSLLLEQLPKSLETLALTAEGECMSFKHQTLPIWGVQFHPESILTPQGLKLLANWLNLCKTR